jgi:hypothetical protein
LPLPLLPPPPLPLLPWPEPFEPALGFFALAGFEAFGR